MLALEEGAAQAWQDALEQWNLRWSAADASTNPATASSNGSWDVLVGVQDAEDTALVNQWTPLLHQALREHQLLVERLVRLSFPLSRNLYYWQERVQAGRQSIWPIVTYGVSCNQSLQFKSGWMEWMVACFLVDLPYRTFQGILSSGTQFQWPMPRITREALRQSMLQTWQFLQRLWMRDWWFSWYRRWRSELRSRRTLFRLYRAHHATFLGFLVHQSMPPRSLGPPTDLRRPTGSRAPGGSASPSTTITTPLSVQSVRALTEAMQETTSRCLLTMNGVLDALLSFSGDPQMSLQSIDSLLTSQHHQPPTSTAGLGSLRRLSSQQTLEQVQQLQQATQARLLNPEEASQLHAAVQQKAQRLSRFYARLHAEYGRPSAWIRYWLPGTLGVYGAWKVIRIATFYQGTMSHWIAEAYTTAVKFVQNWVVEPCRQIWKTVRHEDALRLTAGTASLSSDLESLERMVVDYAADQHLLTPEELLQVQYQIREGDMSLILRSYEQNIKHPLQNALSGDLIRLVLIQIHKTKVDLEIAMQALDKLLRSNELNFAVLAVVPTLLVVGATGVWVRGLWQRRKWGSLDKTYLQLRTSLREVERLLNQTDPHKPLDYVVLGHLLVELYVLRQQAYRLPWTARSMFLEDVAELEQVETLGQKMNTLSRVYRTHGFLSLPGRNASQ